MHGSHYGLVKQNVVFGGAQLTGAGIAVEDGTETENLFEENFVANIRGSINPRESGPGTADGMTPGSAAECFWAAGFNNRFVNNVASSCRNPVQQIVSGPGWKFIVPAAPYTARNPRFRGADMADVNQTVAVTPQHQPILEFRGNEVYGLAADGLTAWELGTDGYGIIPPTMGVSLIKDFRVWHTYEGAIYNYPAHRMTVDGLVYRIDPAATQYWPAAFQCGDYRNVEITIRGGTIHAGSVFGGCTDPLGSYLFENVDAVTQGSRLLIRDSRNARNRRRPSFVRRDDGSRETISFARGPVDRCKRLKCSTRCRAVTVSRTTNTRSSSTTTRGRRATTSACISGSRRIRISMEVLRPATTPLRARRSTASRAR